MDWNSLPKLSTARGKLLRKLKSRKHRREQGLFVAEGVRLVEEVVRWAAEIEWAVAAETDDPRGRNLITRLAGETRVFRTGARNLDSLLDAVAPQPVAAVCRMPETGLDKLEIPGRALVVICDTLRDPGNFGAVVRTAAAAGCTAVVAAGNNVDPWNPKAVRGSMGGIFRLPVVECGEPGELAEFLDRHGFTVFLANMAGQSLFTVEKIPARCALILGGESGGVGECTAGLNQQPLSVPMTGGTESLNVAVAAGVMIYHLIRNQGAARR
ncbi:MAG: RNA methyltransferase [Candidatus Glassbacteria bacterium]|nr:RNA methyltransferase [Candidatus Glassbacteria bacterium]